MRRPVTGLLWFALAGLLAGCAGYQLGPTNREPAGHRAVEVQFFRNAVPQPRLSETVNTSLRRAVQQDGTFRLATQGDGDILVTGELLRMDRPPLSFQPQDTLTVRDYRMVLVARVKAVERITGKTLFDREVTGSTIVRILADQVNIERQALPILADDLARKITGLLADGSF